VTLSPLDEYPIHQAPLSMRHVATSDRNFYDRSYFNAHPPTGELFCVFGMGQYPNLGVQDGFLLVADAECHRVVRASRALTTDRMDTTCGPLAVEVVEPLRVIRVTCAEGEGGLSCDMTWTGSIPAHEEPGQRMRLNERQTFDSMRYAQTGRWEGWLEVDGVRHDVTPDLWWGSRDRSWGVRPVGEPEPAGINAARPMEGFFWVYAPMQFDGFSILCIRQDEADGSPVLRQAVRAWPDGRIDDLGRPELSLRFREGTREVTGATWHLTETDGSPLEVQVEVLLPVWLGKGTGYGFDDDWRHGMWQGDEVVQAVRHDLTDPAVAGGMFGIQESVSRFTCGDAVGHGMLEWLFLGRHDPSGWTGW
jgi:hypothetical protein